MASELIEREIYGGKYKITHNPNARGRAPRYVVENLKTKEVVKPKGVTTILGKVLAKDLVSWAIGACLNYLREKLPMLTEEDLQVAAVEHERLRDAGGSAGTEAHKLVEDYLKGNQPNLSVSEEAQKAYRAFVGWFESEQPEVLGVEEVVYSESLQYAGTYDCLLKIDGEVYLCDLKTTNASRKAPQGVYPEHFLQLGAYAKAHTEMGGVKIDGLMVISAKKNGKLDVITNEAVGLSVDDCINRAENVVGLYHFLQGITDELGGKA